MTAPRGERILGLVPARGGSRRVARKNLRQLGGRTLVRRALETALAADRFATVALSSEDPDILAEAESLDGVAVVRRPAELATDQARTLGVILHALVDLEGRGEAPYDAVGVVQCTTPFTAPEDLRGAIDHFTSTAAPAVVTVSQVEAADHPLKLKRLEGDRLLPWLEDDAMTPSQELPRLWTRNGALYLMRRATLEEGRILPDDVRAWEMPPERSLDVDTPTDLAFAQFLLDRQALSS